SLTFTMTPRLDVTNVEGFEELLKKFEGDDPSIKKAIRGIITLSMVKQTAKEAFLAYVPDQAVEKSATWPGRRIMMELGVFGELEAQEGKGTLYFDTVAGRLIQMESSLQLRGNLTLLQGGTTTEITDLVEDIKTTMRLVKEEK